MIFIQVFKTTQSPFLFHNSTCHLFNIYLLNSRKITINSYFKLYLKKYLHILHLCLKFVAQKVLIAWTKTINKYIHAHYFKSIQKPLSYNSVKFIIIHNKVPQNFKFKGIRSMNPLTLNIQIRQNSGTNPVSNLSHTGVTEIKYFFSFLTTSILNIKYTPPLHTLKEKRLP